MELKTRFSERTKVYWLDGTSIRRGQVLRETFSVKYSYPYNNKDYREDTVTHYCVVNPEYVQDKDSLGYLDKKDMLCRVPAELVFDSFDKAVDELTNSFNQYIEMEVETERDRLRYEEERKMRKENEDKSYTEYTYPNLPYTGPVVYATVTDCITPTNPTITNQVS